MSALAEQDLSVLHGLTEELARLRGAGSVGAPPPLDHEANDDHAHGNLADEDPAPEIEEALERMQTELQAAKARAVLGDREALQIELLNRDGRAKEGRDALNNYLEELRSRADETGDAVRSAGFASDVDALAQRGRLERVEYDSTAGGGAVPATQASNVAKIIQHVNDPATMDALLEVQRLDEALASTELKQAEAQQSGGSTFLTEASAGDAATASAAREPKPKVRKSAADQRASDASDASTADALGASLSALHEEIGRLKGIESSGAMADGQLRADSIHSTSKPSATGEPDGQFIVGGRRRVGGVWISVADEARIEALLAEDGVGEGADEDEAAVGFGQGYRPPREAAERLAAIDAALDELSNERAFSGAYNLHAELAMAPLESESVLGEMRAQRAEKAELGRIRDRLAQLHATPSTELASDPAEVQQLMELLAAVHKEAEGYVDSRPSTARPLSSHSNAAANEGSESDGAAPSEPLLLQ